MKQPSRLLRMFALAVALAVALTVPAGVRAAVIIKADNTNALDQGISWVNGIAPGSGDIATWSGAYSGGAATGVVTNSLYAVFDNGSSNSWGGINVGALTGSCLIQSPIFNKTTSFTNITAATESVVNGFNLVTITCNAGHRFENGEVVTISGVTPAGYNGTYVVAGVPAATQFTYTNAVSGLGAGTAFGTADANMYIGASGVPATGSTLTNGSSGITIASGAPGVALNAGSYYFSGNQTWNLAPGTLLRFNANNATAIANNSGNDGLIEITGGGIASLNQDGGSTYFNDGGSSFAGFSGNWQVDSGTTLRGIRFGADAWGSGTITLNGGILAAGGMSGDVGNWTWTTPIILASGTTSYISEQNTAGTSRFLQLYGAFSGSGNLVFTEPLVAATTFTSTDGGFTWCADGSGLSGGTITIGGPVENGVPGRLTYLRVGGANINSINQSGSGANGWLGSGNIINNGVLTFTLNILGNGNVPGQISGSGTLRIGTLTSTAAFIGDASQNITLNGVNTYTGPTIINAGTLTLAAGASIANSSSILIATNSVNSGAIINTFDVSQLSGGFTTAPGQTLAVNGGQLNGNFTFGLGSTNIIAPGGSNTVGTLTINGNLILSGGSNTVVLDINNSGNDQVSVSGNLTASGVTTLQFVPPVLGLNAGTYTLITASGTLTATPANFNITGLAPLGRNQTFNVIVNGNSVELVVVGNPDSLTWTGDGTANVWNVETTSNWFNNTTSVKDVFYAGDLVTFDDTGSAAPAVNLSGNLSPGTITMNNNNNNYTFGGAGQISGIAAMTLNGSGMLTLLTSNTFVGGEVLNAGTLAITNEAALGEPTNPMPASLTFAGGALLVTNTMTLGVNTNRGILLASAGSFIVTNGLTLTVSNVINDTGGNGVLTELGGGTLILDGNNTYGGGTIVQNGTVIYGNGQALGRLGNTSGTSGFYVPPFELDSGVVDINGQFSYQPNTVGGTDANGAPGMLYNKTLNFNGVAGATLLFQDSGAISTGWGSTAATVLDYNGANNPGTLTINARFAIVGSSLAATRTFTVDDSTATATEVDITAPMGAVSVNSTNQDGRNTTIIKNGSGTMQISAANTFPIMKVDAGILRVNHPQALGADRSGAIGVPVTPPNPNTGSPNQLIVDGGTVDLNGFSPAIGALSDNGGITTGMILNNGASASTLTLGYSISNEVNNASYAGIIADGTGAIAIAKIGTNTQVLAGVNTYSGPTTVGNGILLINSPGQIGLGTSGSTVNVMGGSLGGSGIINAPVIVQSGGTLAPSAGAVSTTTLTITTNLTFSGTNIMNVDKDTATNDLVVLTAGTVNYGGTLVVSTNLMSSTTLALGDSFQLFNASAHTGNFSNISGSPGAGLAWSFNPASGVLSVVGFVPQPGITGISLSGNNLVINGTNGLTGEQYNVLTSTNLALPLSQWTALPTNTFSAGSFSITNTVDSSAPQSFYILRVP